MRFAVFLVMLAWTFGCRACNGGTPRRSRDQASVDVEGRSSKLDPPRRSSPSLHREPPCRELDTLAKLRQPGVQILGLNYRGHEEYDGRGNADAVRRYVATNAPWLRVVPADDQLFELLGQPPKVPTLYVYDRHGALVTIYDRRDRAMPTSRARELPRAGAFVNADPRVVRPRIEVTGASSSETPWRSAG
jgi:hypothetical protein